MGIRRLVRESCVRIDQGVSKADQSEDMSETGQLGRVLAFDQ